MEFFKVNTKIPFMKQRFAAAIFSTIILLASIISLAVYRLNLALDFTGGFQVEVTFQQPVSPNHLRESLTKQGFAEPYVQAYSARDVSVRVAPQKGMTADQIKQKIITAMPDGKIGSLEYIGPQVGAQLFTNGILAIVVALIGTMIYIALRFDYRFAVSAAVALLHDPIFVLGIFSFFHLNFGMIELTAILTLMGYSLNDTIVVYDRIRENFRKMRKSTPKEIVDASINQTLSRTIMTSGLTLFVVIALYIFGGPTIHGFSLAMIIGIIIGTYSSIYVAGSMAISLGLDRTSLIPSAKKVEDNLP